jgi:FimV-like protein
VKSEPVKSEPVAEEDDLMDLGDLSFDDTMLADDAEEESPYKPRTGNECDTKLDLATAYEAMGDVTEAIEILDEVIAEGTPAQVETAQRLKQTWQSS